MRKFMAIFMLIFLLAGYGAYGSSAVYWCTYTFALGYAWNFGTAAQAETAAYQTCVNNGGTNPKYIVSSAYGGYGVVMFGWDAYGTKWISAQVSYSSADQAKNAAIGALQSVGAVYDMYYYSFYDSK